MFNTLNMTRSSCPNPRLKGNVMASEIFWQDQYERIGNMARAWRLASDDLLIAADILLAERDRAMATLPKAGRRVPRALRVGAVALMLRACAVEALLKARAVRRGHKFAVKGKFIPAPGSGRGHDLVGLAQASRFTLSGVEMDLLGRLAPFLETGRYPIPKTWNAALRHHPPAGWVSRSIWSSADDPTFRGIVRRLRRSAGR